MKTTHIEVAQANKGKEIYGIEDGQMLKIEKETECFYFVKSFAGNNIKVSKQTHRACSWSNQRTSPVFNF